MAANRRRASEWAMRAGLVSAFLTLFGPSAGAADLVVLSPENWDRYAPRGKEVDCIHGDFVLCNEQIIAVIGRPVRGRNANMTVREVGGAVIDLTHRDKQSDQLSAYYPGGQLASLRFAGVDVYGPKVYETSDLGRMFVRGESVTLRCIGQPREGTAGVAVSYTLKDGWPYILVETTFTNPGRKPVDMELFDTLRADRSFEKAPDGRAELFWVYDKCFGQAYGLLAEGHEVLSGSGPNLSNLRLLSEGKSRGSLAAGESYRLTRRLIPGSNLLEVKATANRLSRRQLRRFSLTVKDSAGKAVPEADVELITGGERYGSGRTNEVGQLIFEVPPGAFEASVTALGSGTKALKIATDSPESLETILDQAGSVVGRITDEHGGPIPCKVQFMGRDGTPDPDFGPASGEHAVKNLYYSHDGRFRQTLPPGRYQAVVSYGPEYDAGFSRIEVSLGEETPLQAKLVRSVKTPGWISADFHSHSSPSGDNTSSQLGRVLNLLCEHVEFAPCTEHNRISTYVPHLKGLGVERLMATCTGMELTGKPLPINHQNAFPLVMRPGAQDNGAPQSDEDPEVQIERLALWDQGSEKLVQINHPDIGHMFFDRNGDGKPDEGYRGMVGHMDVIEVHPPHFIFKSPSGDIPGRSDNTIFNWLQLLNRGHRVPGVVNTDAHENFHGSGWLRNYLKCPTDDPAEVSTLDVVHAAERGHLIMTNGPYLEVRLRSEGNSAKPEGTAGDEVTVPGGKATLLVRVQCPNWFDVDRVQVFLNGRPTEALNYTRKSTPGRFSDGPVKFEGEIPLELKGDTHVIVAAVGEHSKLGPVMGPEHEKDLPVAVANPIFVDVDGGGFKANGDDLGAPLPVKGGRVAK